jgi:hypothetical protein
VHLIEREGFKRGLDQSVSAVGYLAITFIALGVLAAVGLLGTNISLVGKMISPFQLILIALASVSLFVGLVMLVEWFRKDRRAPEFKHVTGPRFVPPVSRRRSSSALSSYGLFDGPAAAVPATLGGGYEQLFGRQEQDIVAMGLPFTRTTGAGFRPTYRLPRRLDPMLSLKNSAGAFLSAPSASVGQLPDGGEPRSRHYIPIQ